MNVEVGSYEWNVEGLQHDKERRRVYKESDEKLDYIEYSIILHFDCPAAAKHCFSHYEYNEDVRIDIRDDDRYTGEKHLESRMKAKRVEGCRVIFEREKAMGKLAPELLSDTTTN